MALFAWLEPSVARAGGGGLVPTRPAMSRSNPAPVRGLSLGPSPVPGTVDPDEDDDGTTPSARIVERDELKAQGAVKSELLGKKNIPPFWFKQDYDTHTTKGIGFPPLFIHRTPKEGYPQKFLHADLSLTFGWYDKRKSKKRWMNPAVLFFGAFDEHQSSWAALPLLMGYKRVGEKYNFGAFPLVWAWGGRANKNLLVVPFHFQNKTPDSFQGVSALVFWYGQRNLDDGDISNDRKHFIGFPVFWRFVRGNRALSVSPLYIGGGDKERGFRHHTVLPLFHWQSAEGGNRTELWTAAWIRRKDVARGRDHWVIPPLVTFDTRNGPRRLAAYTPAVWRFGNYLKQSKGWVVGPGGWYADGQQKAHWLAPLYYHFTDTRTGAKAGLFAPLAFWQHGPEATRVHTLFGYGSKLEAEGKEGWRFGVHPLLTYAGKSGAKSHAVALGGLFWRTRDDEAERKAWGVGPFAYRTKTREGGRFGIPPLLTFAGSKGDKSFQVVTPLFVHAKNRDPANAHDSYVVGPAYFSKQSGGFSAGLAPLVFAKRTEAGGYGVIPPLVTWWSSDREAGTSRFINPLFIRTKSPEGRTLGIAGIAWDAKREVEGEMQRDSVLFPLYYRRQRGDRSVWVSPVGGGIKHANGGGWAAGPVYGWSNSEKGRGGWGAVPLVFHTRRDDGGRSTVVPGLFIRDRRPERDLDMWTPLLWRSEVRGENARKGLAVVPFYFRQRQPGGYQIDAGIPGFPFYWGRNPTRRTHTLIAGPFYHHLTRKALHTGVFPLTWWKDSEEERRLIGLPLVYHFEKKKTGLRTTLAFPVWFDRQLANGRRTWMAFPFVFGREYTHDFTRASVAPPGYFDIYRLRKNFRFTGMVPLLFRYQKCGFRLEDDPKCRYTLWGSFPVFMYGKDGEGRRTHSALGLYWSDRTPDSRKFLTWLGGYSYKKDERTLWYAGPIARDVTRTHATTAFLPLFFHKKHRTLSRNTTLVLPPMFIQRRRDDRNFWEAGLLVWQSRTPAKITTVVVPPIFGHQHVYKERRLTWLAPLFVRDNNFGNDETWTSVLPALYVQHREGDRNAVVQFPLVWHFASRDRHTTLGFPLYWDFRRPGTRTQVVPGLWVRRQKGNKTLNMVGPLLGWWTKTPDGKHWSALLGLFGGGHEGEQRYMHLFGQRIKLKSKPPRERRGKKTKGSDPAVEGEVEAEAGASTSRVGDDPGRSKTRRRARRQARRAAQGTAAPL